MTDAAAGSPPGEHAFAVVVPAFNAERTIGACLRSVLAQTTPPSEIIVVDDGSSDSTAEVARACSDRIQVIQQENSGSAVARQVGTEAATAQYVAYLDADDWWPRTRLSACREIVEEAEVHFLMTDFVRSAPGNDASEFLPRNTIFHPWFTHFLSRHGVKSDTPGLFRLAPGHALEAVLRGFPCYPSATVVRRSSVVAAGGWDRRFRRCQDFDVALRLARRYPIHFLDRVEAIIGLHENNLDADRYLIQQTCGDIQVLESHLSDHADDQRYRRQVAAALGRKNYELAGTYARTGNHLKARGAYLRAVKWPGLRWKALVRAFIS